MLGFVLWALTPLLAFGDVQVPLKNHWNGGFQGDICFTITQDMHSWKVHVMFDQPVERLEVWKADIDSTNEDKTEYTLVSKQFNGDEHTGEQLCIDFIGHGDGDIAPNITASMEGVNGGGTFIVTSYPNEIVTVSLAPGETRATTTSLPLPEGEGITATMVIHDDHVSEGRFEGWLDFDIDEVFEGWVIKLLFSKGVTAITQMFHADVYSHNEDGTEWIIINNDDKLYMDPGDKLELRIQATVADKTGAPQGTALLMNMGKDTNWSLDPLPNTAGSKYNYDDVLYKSILFYEAQRSGKLPANNRIPWRGDSALKDGADNGVDISGGWYDAGDFVKFNLPLAWTTVILEWGLLEFKDAYDVAGQTEWMYECVQWPLDYLLKCHVADDVLYVQVGDPSLDHGKWGRPEEMTMLRPSYKIDASKPGSEVAMETAAAFAAGYLLFKDRNSSYADTLLQHAKTLWEFAIKHPGRYSESVTAAAGFYTSSNTTDELCWGSLWLYKATGDQKYMDAALANYDGSPDWGISWDDVLIGNQLLMYNLTGDPKYQADVEKTFQGWFPGGDVDYTPKGLAWRLQWGSLRYTCEFLFIFPFLCHQLLMYNLTGNPKYQADVEKTFQGWFPGGDVDYTPKGLAWRLQWGSLRAASNMAMAALIGAGMGIEPREYRHWAMCQIHYALGDTGRSYVVGYGTNPPVSPHHRASSCPIPPATCNMNILHLPTPNVHTLYGALVGGPDASDGYEDKRNNYINNEVANDYNAGFQTAVAALRHLLLINEHPEQTGTGTCPYTST